MIISMTNLLEEYQLYTAALPFMIISFAGCFVGPFLFAKYFCKGSKVSGIILSLIGLCTFIFISFHQMRPEYFGDSDLWMKYLIFIVFYPFLFKNFLEKYKKGERYLEYVIFLIIINIIVWLCIYYHYYPGWFKDMQH